MEVLQRAFGTALEQGSFRGELRLKPPGKGPMDCDLSMTRVVLDGRVGVQTTMRDITASKAAQDEQLRLLAERTTLLDEVHHRVKNNLQVVSSLLYLQQSSSNDADVVEQLQVSRDRIAAISLVHERLYRTSDFGRIDVQPFLVELCESIRAATIAGDRVKLNVYGTDFALELGEAVPIALIVSELISNSMKHAFPGGRRGAIRLWTGFVSGGKRMIRVSDDGVGMRGDPKRVGSLGLDLVQRLAGQISATVAREDSVKGVCWVLQLAAVDIRVDEDVQVVQ